MKAKLAIIAILMTVVASVGCDEAIMVDDIITNGPVEGIVQAELKQIEGESADTPTHPVNREEILNFPGEDATDEERQAHWDLVVAAAVNVNFLDISGCTPTPLVIEVGYGEAIEIRNSDTVFPRTLWHGGARFTIPAGSTSGMVVTEFVGTGEGDGIAGYGCHGYQGGIFFVNSRLGKHVAFRVVQFLSPDGGSGPGIEGVRVTPLEGSNEGTKETLADGFISFSGDLPLTVLLQKEDHITTEATILEEGQVIALSSGKRNISFRVIEPPTEPLNFDPNLPNINPGIERVTVTCLEGSHEGPKETDKDGSVSFFGTPPITVRIEKSGYITTEAVVGEGSKVVFPNEWPEEAAEAIRQLGLTEMIASGRLMLRWGDEEYLDALGKRLGNNHIGGLNPCPNIIVKKYEDRDFMVWILIHELMHAWQGLNSTNPPCGTMGGSWLRPEEAKAWIDARDKDLLEFGPFPGLDDREWAKPLEENQAGFYSYWYMGPETDVLNEKWDRPAELKKLYLFAPNRCKYMEDRFGPPPPR